MLNQRPMGVTGSPPTASRLAKHYQHMPRGGSREVCRPACESQMGDATICVLHRGKGRSCKPARHLGQLARLYQRFLEVNMTNSLKVNTTNLSKDPLLLQVPPSRSHSCTRPSTAFKVYHANSHCQEEPHQANGPSHDVLQSWLTIKKPPH